MLETVNQLMLDLPRALHRLPIMKKEDKYIKQFDTLGFELTAAIGDHNKWVAWRNQSLEDSGGNSSACGILELNGGINERNRKVAKLLADFFRVLDKIKCMVSSVLGRSAAKEIFDIDEIKILLRQQFEVLAQEVTEKKMSVSRRIARVEPSLARTTGDMLSGVGAAVRSSSISGSSNDGISRNVLGRHDENAAVPPKEKERVSPLPPVSGDFTNVENRLFLALQRE